MQVSDIITRARLLLNDTQATRWTADELIGWFNDAQAEIVTLRPDANIVSGPLALVPGIQQAIPSPGIVLSNVFYNTNSDATLHGSVVRECNREDLDRYLPTWPAQAAHANVIHFMREKDEPKRFWVYPAQPNDDTGFVLTAYSSIPAIQGVDEDTQLGDEYVAATVDYMAYRSFAKDAEGANATRATAHYSAFLQSLGLTEAASAAAGSR